MNKRKRITGRQKKLKEFEDFFFDMYNHWELTERDWQKVSEFLKRCKKLPYCWNIEI